MACPGFSHHSQRGFAKGVRLCKFCRINSVMLGDGAVDAEYYRHGFAGQVRDAQRPLAPFDMGFRNVNNLVHDALLAAPQNPYVESPWEIALGQAGEPVAPILPAPMLEDSKSSCRRLGTAALRQSKLSSWWRTAPGPHPSV